MEAVVPVMVPNVAIGAGPEPPPQLAPGLPSSTWFGALNISMRNSMFLFSAIWKYFVSETSSFPRHGPLRMLRPQLPNVPASGLENAAELNQPLWPGVGRTGSTPVLQLRRVAVVKKRGPPETHAAVVATPPLCSVVMVLTCHPPTT